MYHRDPFTLSAKFAATLKDMVHRAFGLDVRHDHFESCKDEPQEVFHGKTPRQVYIAFSETFVKPLYGVGFFGSVLRESLLYTCAFRSTPVSAVAISDSGFREEALEVMKGFDKVLLVRIHRPGKTFDGDGRSYIELPTRTIDVQNDSPGAPEMIARHILEIV